MSSSTPSNNFNQFNFTPTTKPFPVSNTSLTLNNISLPNNTNPFSSTNTSINNTTNSNSNKRKLDVPLSFSMNKRRRINGNASPISTTKSPESMDDNTSNTSNNPLKYRYSIDEKVLVLYTDNTLYQSKIMNRKLDTNNILYFIHYEGWNDKWDSWVGQEKILPYTQQNIQLMQGKQNIKNAMQNGTKNVINNGIKKNKKSKEVRKKIKTKIAMKSNKNKLNYNTNLNANTNANASNISLLSTTISSNDNEKYFELENKYSELERKYNNLLQKQQQTEQKQQQTENKCNKYKDIIGALYKECVEGESPRWHTINTNDREDKVIRDRELAQLRFQIGSLYPKGRIEVSGIGQWKDKPYLKEAVYKFVTINGEYKVNAFVWIGGLVKKISDMLVRFKVVNHPRIPALNGQFGVRCIKDIPKNTCIGQYFGAEILQSAFGKVYDGTSEEYDHNIYAFDQTIDPEELIKLKQKRKELKRYKKNSNNNNSNDSDDMIEDKTFIIDPFVGDWTENELLLKWVNDCRCDIFENVKPTSNDKKYYNVEYVGMKVNGWPQTYCVTRRDIKKGEELMTYYGEKFATAIQEQEAEQKRKRIKKERIDRDVMKAFEYELIK